MYSLPLENPCPECGYDLNKSGLITEDNIYSYEEADNPQICPNCKGEFIVLPDAMIIMGEDRQVLTVEKVDW